MGKRKRGQPSTSESSGSVETGRRKSRKKALSQQPTTCPQLCSRCLAIDFDDLPDLQALRLKGPYGVPIMELGTKGELGTSNCILCRFFASMVRENVPEHSLCHLGAFPAVDILGISLKPEDAVLLGVVDNRRCHAMDDRTVIGSLGLFEMKRQGCIGIRPPRRQDDWAVRDIGSPTLNMSIVITWLSYCLEHHRAQCMVELSRPIDKYWVINCASKEVVEAPPHCRYAALSYVWGGDDESTSGNTDDTAVKGSVKFLKVIEDSIFVAMALGLEYLWVDRVCIDQQNAAEKHHQIRQMDLIYQASAVTIIAAAGHGPHFGLPGVRDTKRRPQPSIRIGDHVLLSTCADGHSVLSKSTWNSRSWTYQEGILSTRRLIFTEEQVYFECNGISCREAVDVPLNWLEGCNRTIFDAYSKLQPPGKEPSEFIDHVRLYSDRRLTYPGDILNAFQGILQAFQTAQSPVYHFWGMPIYLASAERHGSSLAEHFAVCLVRLFDRGRFERRPNFPSWSWTGWYGAYLAGPGDRDCPGTQIWLTDTHGDRISLDEIDLQEHGPNLTETYINIIDIETLLFVVELEVVRFSEAERSDLAASLVLFSGATEVVCARFTLESGLRVYSQVEGPAARLPLSTNHECRVWMLKDWRRGYTAPLFENVGTYFEGVGTIRLDLSWYWDNDGKLRSREDWDEEEMVIAFQGIKSLRERIQLG